MKLLVTRRKNIMHGLTKSVLYHRWVSMMSRCYNPNFVDYPNYGARGIKVCKRWHKLTNFVSDMLPTFKKGLTLDRINNDSDYSPKNCRWATMKEQNRNQRKTMFITVDGITRCASEWAEINGIRRCLVHERLRKGVSPCDAVLPIKPEHLQFSHPKH